MKEELTVDLICKEARLFAEIESTYSEPAL